MIGIYRQSRSNGEQGREIGCFCRDPDNPAGAYDYNVQVIFVSSATSSGTPTTITVTIPAIG